MTPRNPRQTKSSSTSARRPSAGRSGTSAQRARRPGVPKVAFERTSRNTNRLVVLLMVVGVLGLSFASSARAYLNQQDQIRKLQAEIAQYNAANAAGKAEIARLKDPAYIEQLGRLRFGWVMPGQTPYIVLKDGQPLDSNTALDTHQPTVASKPVAWWSRVSGSLQDADNPPAPPKSKPKPSTKVE